MFSLNQTIKIANVNARCELHGEDHKIATDIKIEANVSNDMLSEFHPDLKSFLYIKDEDVKELDLGDANRATKLRMPLMGVIAWGWEGAGYHLNVDYGINDSSAIKLGDCQVDHLRMCPKEGGTVALTIRVIAHPNQEDIGKLCSLIQQEASITLTPPSVEEKADEVIDNAKKKSARKKAEDAFSVE